MKTYTPIPGLGTGRGGFQLAMRHRLFYAADHLLLVQSTGYTEDYRRIYYRDIRYVVTRKDTRYLWLSFILALPLIGFCLLLLSHLSWILIAPICLFFGGLLLLNLLRGPSCRCYIVTNVQTLAVPTPARVRKIPTLIHFLRTKIADPPGESAAT